MILRRFIESPKITALFNISQEDIAEAKRCQSKFHQFLSLYKKQEIRFAEANRISCGHPPIPDFTSQSVGVYLIFIKAILEFSKSGERFGLMYPSHFG